MTVETKHLISLDQAKQLTARFRKGKTSLLNEEFAKKDVLPVCETFERSAFDQILAQPGCVGVRAYYGMDEESKVHLLFVGVNEKNEDILPAESEDGAYKMRASATWNSGNAVIVENGNRCPNECPPASTINP